MGLFKKDRRGSAQSDVSANMLGSAEPNEDKPNGARRSSLFRSSSSQSNVAAQTSRRTSTIPAIPEVPQIPIPKAPDPNVDPVGYLRSIYAVRERCQVVLEKAKQDGLKHFRVDMTKFPDVAKYVVSIIKRDYAPDYSKIPPHGRWQHFEVGGVPRIQQLLESWLKVDAVEKTRRLLDLFLVSVLLDAGAGSKWSYHAQDGKDYKRSEGLAVASLEMFNGGAFSSDPNNPQRVDGSALKQLTIQSMQSGLQVSNENPLDGLEGRTELLVKLGTAMDNQSFFGADGRPGNMLDYLLSHPTTHSSPTIICIPTLWSVVMDGLYPIWPTTRTQLDDRSLGDAWPCSVMPSHPTCPWENIVPFHKLSQWLTYSLMVPMQRLLGIHFAGAELMTGLAEYRNGGLLMDLGLMVLRSEDAKRGLAAYRQNAEIDGQPSVEVVPLFRPDDDVVVEWRAVTVGMLDELLVEVNKLLGLFGTNKLNLAQMLEAGSWKGGREIAEIQRPNTRGPPIMILSDGTVF